MYSSDCGFHIRSIYNGYLGAADMIYSGSNVDGSGKAIEPVVSLNVQLLEKNADKTYNIK